MFGADLRRPNQVINFCTNGKEFYVLATARLSDFHFTGVTQCLPLYHYTKDSKQVSNITDWGLRQFRERYGDDSISAEDVFAYTYGVLHDPMYREKYAIDLLREFPRLPFYPEFWDWVKMGRRLVEMHTDFESVEPYPQQTVEQTGEAKRVTLRADQDEGRIILDDVTTLAGVPPDAWRYRLGSRSALSGCWTSTRSASHGTRQSRPSSIATSSLTTRSGSSTCYGGYAGERSDHGGSGQNGPLGETRPVSIGRPAIEIGHTYLPD